MPPEAAAAVRSERLFATKRTDAWWVGPAVTGALLLAFIGWATYRAFENDWYLVPFTVGEYLSPFFSPLITGLPIPPSFLILWAPAGFRVTCYYYRKAYYRSLFLTPPACGVRGAQKGYKGETFILLFQNLHRYLLYVAILFLFFLWHDAYLAFRFDGGFGVRVGSIVLTLNAVGNLYVGTLANGGVGLAPFHDLADQVPADLASELTALEAAIISGSVAVN